MRPNRDVRPILVWVLASLVLAGGLGGCDRKKPPPPPAPPKVGVVTLKTRPVALTTDLPGRTVAYRVADVRPQVSGIVQKRLFVEGAEVKAGQQLYQIDAAPYQAAYDSAVAALGAAKELAERYKSLVALNAVSKQDYANAVATQQQDAAAAETAHINLVYTRVLSPISGRIGRSSVTEGALVTANQATALATVQQLDPIYVDAEQPGSVLLRLKREFANGKLTSGDAHAAVHLTLEDGSAYEPAGSLQFSEVSIDETTGAVTLRAVFPNPDRLLLPGMFVHERLEEGVTTAGVLAPQQGVTHDQKGEPTALVVGAGNKVELRRLKADRAIGDKWLVTDGLKPGDRLIVEGLQFVKPGAEVTPAEFQADEAPPPNPAAAQ